MYIFTHNDNLHINAFLMTITTPQKPEYTAKSANAGTFTISGCYPGYGTTIGNALRRVLLSSLSGSAITAVKIKGVSHEFSGIDGVMEDVVQIILNLKRVRVRSFVDGPVTMTLAAKGEGSVTASQIETPANVEIVNGDHVIATITDKNVSLEMEMEVQSGIGYLPVEQQNRDEKEIGQIAIDAIFTPIRRVNYTVENMRVGKRTDYDKVMLEIETDGSITPQEAFGQGVAILIEQFSALKGIDDAASEEVVNDADTEEGIAIDSVNMLSTRTVNVLNSAKLSTLEDVAALTEDELNALDGMGAKGVDEVKNALAAQGLSLKES